MTIKKAITEVWLPDCLDSNTKDNECTRLALDSGAFCTHTAFTQIRERAT